MSDHWARRWQKNGHDRLYVHGPDGVVGWVDLATGQVHAQTRSSWSTAADRAVADWKRSHVTTTPATTSTSAPTPAPIASSRRGDGLFGALRRGRA
ncbi:hypothetical protein ACQPXM_41430 (plasmid) [Kribbella sp. CA-253562]|uniref:hypothetical protein n=1 Tax=Kribbella sp. CA-253562 TaxID=3239942 RepID=UPI003D89F02A